MYFKSTIKVQNIYCKILFLCFKCFILYCTSLGLNSDNSDNNNISNNLNDNSECTPLLTLG